MLNSLFRFTNAEKNRIQFNGHLDTNSRLDTKENGNTTQD